MVLPVVKTLLTGVSPAKTKQEDNVERRQEDSPVQFNVIYKAN